MLLGTCVAFHVVIGDLGPGIISKILGIEVRIAFQFYTFSDEKIPCIYEKLLEILIVLFVKTCKGIFTVIVCISDCNVASKCVPLIAMELFTLSDVKHQKGKSRT